MQSLRFSLGTIIPILLTLAGCSEAPVHETLEVEARYEVAAFESLLSLEREFVLRDDSLSPLAMPVAMTLWHGNLVLIDQMLAQVRVFDQDGHLIQTIGRPGDGPGEFRSPAIARPHPDGELVVFDPMAGRVSLFAPDGTFSESWSFAEFFMNSFAVAASGELIFGGRHLNTRLGGDSAWATIHVFTKQGKHLRSVGYRDPIGSRPFEPNMNQIWVESVGSTAVGFLIASDTAVFHDLETGREWTASVGEDFYEPVKWLRSMPEEAGLDAWREWDARQMLAFWPVAVDSMSVFARFIGPDPRSGERVVYYDLVNLEGDSQQAIRGTLEQNIRFIQNGRAYAFRMSDTTGTVLVSEFSLRPPASGGAR